MDSIEGFNLDEGYAQSKDSRLSPTIQRSIANGPTDTTIGTAAIAKIKSKVVVGHTSAKTSQRQEDV